MTPRRFALQRRSLGVEVLAEDELDALSKAVDADVLVDGDDGSIEELDAPAPDGWEPEGPG